MARAIPDLWQQLGPRGEIVEHRAARGEHQLIERALQVRAPQLRRVPELRFRHDTSARRAADLQRLIDDAGNDGRPTE